LLAVSLVSAGALAYEILLTKIFAIVHWHELVATAISLALLGFGASGSFLFVTRDWWSQRFAGAFVINAWLFAVSALGCLHLAQQVRFDPESLAWDYGALVPLALSFLVLAIPFFAAANCIGLAMMHFHHRIPAVYAADLVGAGLGAILLLAGLAWLPLPWLLAVIMASAACAAIVAAMRYRWHPRVATLGVTTSLIAMLVAIPADIAPAPHKDVSRALAAHGASAIARLHGIEGEAIVVENSTIPYRAAPGMSLQAAVTPPPQRAVFINGDLSAALPGAPAGEASDDYLASLLSALPFTLNETASRVAIIGAGTGTRVRQALSLGAKRVIAIEPNSLLRKLACGRFADGQPGVCDTNRVDWRAQTARLLLPGADTSFDIVTLSLQADPVGTDAMAVDYRATREAFSVYLNSLAGKGYLAIDGPLQVPPRLSIRILETARAALADVGIPDPEQHVVMLRGWQRFIIVISRAPLNHASRNKVRGFGRQYGFDLIWLPGIQRDDANRYQQLATPVFHDLARATLIDRPQDAGSHDAVTDDRPFPYRSTSIHQLIGVFTDQPAYERNAVDVGMLVGVAVLFTVSVAAGALILLPLAWLRQSGHSQPPAGLIGPTLIYFALIGLAFLFVEIAWIQQLNLFLGQPVIATTAVLAGFLIFAGAGSAWSQSRRQATAHRRLTVTVIVIASTACLYLVMLPWVMTQPVITDTPSRVLLSVAMMAPLAFAMGIPFPLALDHLGRHAPALVPWAWGINGAVSVVTAAAAPLLASEIGFSGLTLIAAIAYLLLPMTRLNRRG
jgi:hypothetical protein